MGDLGSGANVELGSWVGECEAEKGREEEEGLHFDKWRLSCRQVRYRLWLQVFFYLYDLEMRMLAQRLVFQDMEASRLL